MAYTLTNLEDDIRNFTEVSSSVLSSSVLDTLIKNAENRIYREIDTDQNINDENPFLAEPIIISSHLFLINNKGFVFKINIDSGKIVWNKNVFN